jgi:hypothetical protein
VASRLRHSEDRWLTSKETGTPAPDARSIAAVTAAAAESDRAGVIPVMCSSAADSMTPAGRSAALRWLPALPAR